MRKVVGESCLSSLVAPFQGTALHYAVAYLDAVMLGAARDMLDRQVHVLCRGCEDLDP
jgi:hypothetical protein